MSDTEVSKEHLRCILNNVVEKRKTFPHELMQLQATRFQKELESLTKIEVKLEEGPYDNEILQVLSHVNRQTASLAGTDVSLTDDYQKLKEAQQHLSKVNEYLLQRSSW